MFFFSHLPTYPTKKYRVGVQQTNNFLRMAWQTLFFNRRCYHFSPFLQPRSIIDWFWGSITCFVIQGLLSFAYVWWPFCWYARRPRKKKKNCVFPDSWQNFQGVEGWKLFSFYHMSHIKRKPVFGGLDQVRFKPACSATETSLSLESLDFSKYRYHTISAVNNKGADQTARMRRLICAFVVRIWQKCFFSWCGSYIFYMVKCENDGNSI